MVAVQLEAAERFGVARQSDKAFRPTVLPTNRLKPEDMSLVRLEAPVLQ